MRRELGVVRLRHARYLLRLQDAAHSGERRLEYRRRLLSEKVGELVLGRQPLAGGYGDGRVPRDPRHFSAVFGRRRLLEPQRVVWLQPLGEAYRARSRHLPVRPYQQVDLVAHRFAYVLGDERGVAQRLQRQLARVEGAHRHHRVELHAGETHFHVLNRALGSANGVAEDVADRERVVLVALVRRRGVEVGV